MTENSYKQVYFYSDKSKISGWFFEPKKNYESVIILFHGTGSQKDFGLNIIAKNFSDNGISSLVFDYRGFGDSENIKGYPKRYLSAKHQIEDILSAINFIRHNKKIKKIGLFGESMSAALAMMAAKDLENKKKPIQAVYSQSPACFEFPKWPFAFKKFIYKSIFLDLLFRNKSIRIYQVSPKDVKCYLPDSFCFWPIIPDKKLGSWDNKIPARSIFNIAVLVLSGKIKRNLKNIKTPILISQGSLDRFLGSSFKSIDRMFNNNKNVNVEIYRYKGEHISALPMVNKKQYEVDKKKYEHESNTYYPEIYKDLFPVYLKFFKKHLT